MTLSVMSSAALPAVSDGPLNPRLYGRLQATFGDVVISAQGEEFVGDHYFDEADQKWKFDLHAGGEKYRVNCPYCDDTRGRLWVSYAFGVLDPKTNSDRRTWAVCYNENCLNSRPGRYGELLDRVYSKIPYHDRVTTPLLSGHKGSGWSGLPIELPGVCLTLDVLHPNHPAVLYLRDERGFDLAELSEKWDVRYCVDGGTYENGGWPNASNRIVVPVYRNGNIVAWQGRWPNENWKDAGKPKHYNLPCSWKSKVLYGVDQAKEYDYVVLVEGTTDAWRLGPPAVSTFGKLISQHQAEIIGNWLPTGGLVFLFGDDAKALEESHRGYERLTKKHDVIVIKVLDPLGRDPAQLSREEAWDLIRQAAAARGYTRLNFPA